MSRSPFTPKRKMPALVKSVPQQNQVVTLIKQGLALHQQGKFTQAQAIYEKVLEIQANQFDALQMLGILFAQTKQFAKAVDFLGKALQINPNIAACHSNRGIALKELGRFDEALASYDKAISLKPNHAEAFHNRGNVLQKLGRLEEALASYDKAISLKSDYVEAYSNRGNVLKDLRRLDDALASYDTAISLKSDYAEAYYNRANALKEFGRLDEAQVSYNKAISVRGDYADAHLSLSLCHLLAGNFKDGWHGYEWRWKSKDVSNTKWVREFSQPLWLGAGSLKDKTILLHAEQGLGDTIQFCRYVPLVAQLGAKVILEVQRPLGTLLDGLDGVQQIVAKGDELPEFAYHCPLLSLPLAFQTAPHTIPPTTQHFASDEATAAKWRGLLGDKIKPRVGIVWSGNSDHKNDHNRSLTLSQLGPHLPSNVEYISLQKEIRDGDKELLAQSSEIRDFSHALDDFKDTVALCELVDLVISVDTSVAHLAGTMGKPTWVLLPFSPDWRWLLDRDDTPWYPSAKLYRQEKYGDWQGVLQRLEADLTRAL